MPKSGRKHQFVKDDAGMPKSRPPLERMMQIHQELHSGRHPNAIQLARQLEVSSKSIYRDLEFMRDRMNLPIEFDRIRNGFFYSAEVTGFPSLQISEGELIALVVAEKALQQYRGTSFERPLLSAFKKISASLPDTISLNLADWDQTISFRTTAEPVLDLETFQIISRAVARNEQLRLHYRKPGNSQIEPRLVDPYHLANVNGEWFLFAWCHLRGDIRTFAPARIRSVEVTGETFKRPAKFSIKNLLSNSFGIHSGVAKYEVVIQFNELVADYIREKKWHPSQRLFELAEGRVELRLTLSSLIEVSRWLLGWGGHAKVIEPTELVDSMREAAEKVLSNYPNRDKICPK